MGVCYAWGKQKGADSTQTFRFGCAGSKDHLYETEEKTYEKVPGRSFLTLALCLGSVLPWVPRKATTYKIGILAPAVTHGWVAGVAYQAEQRMPGSGRHAVEYKLYTSNNAEEMTTQLDDLMTWGAQAIVAFPQWEGMEVPIQAAIDAGIYRGELRYRSSTRRACTRVTGDNEGMGVEGREVHRR